MLDVNIHKRVLTWLNKHPQFLYQFNKLLKELKENPHIGPKLGNSELRKVRITRKYRLLYRFDPNVQSLVLLDVAPSDDVVRRKAYTRKLAHQVQKVGLSSV